MNTTISVRGPQPVAGLAAAYSVPQPGPPTDLYLAGNEGAGSLDLAPQPAEALVRYPSSSELESALARRFGVARDQVLATAGADDALLRIALAYGARGRVTVLPSPTFEMLPRYIAVAGGTVREVAWPTGPYPTEAVLAASGDAAVIAVVSPNNPTGAVATGADLCALAAGAPDALLLVDAAYAEFADDDLTEAALRLPNAVVVRTFSKAYGIAGLRVGYAIAAAPIIAALRAAGNPYPVATAALQHALRLLEPARERELAARVAFNSDARREIAAVLTRCGAPPRPSAGNFLLVDVPNAELTRDLLAGLGIAVRSFPGRSGLERALRITMPTDRRNLERLSAALEAALRPQALFFDLDGVLADVSRSYRAAILATAASFGATVDSIAVERAKARGGANDDWSLTQRLMAEVGVERTLAEVTERFEALYQGRPGSAGLRATETLMVPSATLRSLAGRVPLAIVTGRPRLDAERFLCEHGIERCFQALIAREDAPLKPDPAPVRAALAALGVTRAWMLGDTPDDVRAARAAGVVPLGVLPTPTSTMGPALTASGAARVLESAAEVTELWPC